MARRMLIWGDMRVTVKVLVVGGILFALGTPSARATGDKAAGGSSTMSRAKRVLGRLFGRAQQERRLASPTTPPTRYLQAAAPRRERPRPDMTKMLAEAKHLEPPFARLGYDDSYGGDEGPITIYRTGSAPNRTRLIWFHGAGQATHNELITRLASAFHEAGLNLEIYSVPYWGPFGTEVAKEIAASSPGKVIVGGHGAGGSGVDELLRAVPGKIAAVATVNAGHPRAPGIPALHFDGENDGARYRLADLKGPGGGAFAWGDREIVVVGEGEHRTAILRRGDHSARSRETGDPDKSRASVSPETGRLNLELARTLKQFLDESGVR